MATQAALYVCLLTLISCLTPVLTQVGDHCTVQSSGNSGKCLLLGECPAALEAIRKQQFPQTCGFSGTVPIVCCEGAEGPPPPPPTTPVSPIQFLNAGTKKVGDISRQKCFEYSLYNYELVRPPVFALGAEKVNKSVCGHTVVPLIIGGTPAKPREFPHMAVLGYGEPNNKVWQCGGTLISEQYVLTAGHCLYAQEQGAVKWVRVADLNLKVEKDGARPVELDVAEIIKHPEYKPPSNYNDIALLKLNGVVPLSKYIIPACLHLSSEIPTKRYIATGWGRTQNFGDGSDILLKVVLDGFSQEQCNKTYRADSGKRRLLRGIDPESQMCAGGTDAEKDTCQGDSGGPIQIFHAEAYCMYSVVGVTSFGKVCGAKNIPGVYSRVSNYIEWIEQTVWP